MKFVADLHIHSKYSRATSPEMDIPNLAKWAKLKGIKLLGTGDFTHPLWLLELKKNLESDTETGFFRFEDMYFVLTVELCCIYSRRSKTHRIHNVVILPDFSAADKLNSILTRYGNLAADGRPVLNLDSEILVKIVKDISEHSLIFPAHAWTPHFSVFGSNSGFDSLEECYGKELRHVHGLETGLSSDPPMNWRLSGLDSVTLLSFSDAHSPRKLGREATVFNTEFSYKAVMEAVRLKDTNAIAGTVEFFPEEGKYHYDGHRNCQARIHPAKAIKNDNVCPHCNKRLTIGVLHRVEALADRTEGFTPAKAIPYHNLVPLEEIIAEALDVKTGTRSVENAYTETIAKAGTELDILMSIPPDTLLDKLPQRIAEGVLAARQGNLEIAAGYDGVYGTIKIKWPETKTVTMKEQLSLF